MNIYIIGDTQSKENVKNPLRVIAKHVCDLKPDYVIHLGDHWDMPSLSKYDKGKKSHRVKSYSKDVRAGNVSMQEFWDIINNKWYLNKKDCRFIILKGNHENRIVNAEEYGPDELVDLMNEIPLYYYNWDIVVPFLKIIKIGGINFSHYFQNEGSARPIGTAKQILNKKHSSCIAGHKQGFDYEEAMSDDKMIQAMILGSTYYHDEEYKAQTNHHFRGSVILRNVENGMYDFERFSLKNLDEKYDK